MKFNRKKSLIIIITLIILSVIFIKNIKFIEIIRERGNIDRKDASAKEGYHMEDDDSLCGGVHTNIEWNFMYDEDDEFACCPRGHNGEDYYVRSSYYDVSFQCNGVNFEKSVSIVSCDPCGPPDYINGQREYDTIDDYINGTHRLQHEVANTYTVRYNGNMSNGGSTASSTHTYDTSKNLTANGFTRKYTVTYNHNYSGSTNTSKTAAYTFKNWNTNASGTGTSYSNNASVKNLTATNNGTVNLYAQWTSSSVSYTPTRAGYTFGGWFTTSACTGNRVDTNGTYTPTAATTLYAKWTANKYTLTVDFNGGLGKYNREVVSNYQQQFTYNLSNRFATTDTSHPNAGNGVLYVYRDGYTFKGWTITSGAGGIIDGYDTAVDPDEGLINYSIYEFDGKYAGNVIVQAQWTANTYTVAYNGNGSTGGSTASSTHTYDVEKSLTANGFTRSYAVTYNHNYSGSTNTSKTATYTFKNWNTKADGTGTSYANSASVTNLATSGTFNLYAQWTSSSVSYTPTRTGYTFGGWFTNSDCTGTRVDSSGTYTPIATTTLYAKWTANKYTLTVDFNGGLGKYNREVVSNYQQQFTYNLSNRFATTDTSHPNAGNGVLYVYRDGYTFKGWTITSGAGGIIDGYDTAVDPDEGLINYSIYEFDGKYAGNVIVQAQWTANTYTVAYNGNGSTGGSTASSTHTYDVEKSLTANGFTRSYAVTYNHNYSGSTNTSKTATYTFKNWNTKADGTGTSYANSASVTNLATSGTFNLYAQWTSSSVSYTPTRTGYTFGGWFTNSDCTGTRVDSSGTYTPIATTTLYAKWTANTYTVAYNGNGSTGGSTASSSHTYDVAKALTANGFTRSYTVTYRYNYLEKADTTQTATYTFKNWNTVADGTGTSYANNASVTNLATSGTFNLYAQWDSHSVTNVPERTGYTFGGWFTDAACTGTRVDTNGVYTPAGNTILYAKWTANEYTVKYNGNGSTAGETADSTHIYDANKNLNANGYEREYTVTYNHNYKINGVSVEEIENTSVENPANESKVATYTFRNWNTSANGSGTTYENEESVRNLVASGTFNLYAQWDSHSVTYNPEREGYTFAGWYTNEECIGDRVDEDGEYTPSANITLYAKWTANKYTIIYDGNGYTDGETENSIHTYDAEKALNSNGYIRKYTVTYNHNYNLNNEDNENAEIQTPQNTTRTAVYNFDGWSNEANGEVVYEEEAKVINLATNEGDEVRIYAKWRATSVEYVPVRTGYTFGGWYADEECTRQVITASNPSYTPSRNITLYAKWIANTYTVIYNGNGNTLGETQDSTHTYDVAKSLNANGYKREYQVTYNHNYEGSTNERRIEIGRAHV